MVDEKTGEGTNQQAETSVTKEQYEAVAAENKQLKDNLKAVQRNLERARLAGDSTSELKAELSSIRDALAASLEATGKLATAAELKDVNIAPVLEKLRKPVPVDTAKNEAGVAIVQMAQAAGISEDDFNDAWASDPRFTEARAHWATGNYDASKLAFVSALGKPKVKTYTEEDVKKAAEEGRAAALRTLASADPNKGAGAGASKTITMAEFVKLTPEERVKLAPDLRAAMHNASRS